MDRILSSEVFGPVTSAEVIRRPFASAATLFDRQRASTKYVPDSVSMGAFHSGSGSPAARTTLRRSLSPTDRMPRPASLTADLNHGVARRPARRTSSANDATVVSPFWRTSAMTWSTSARRCACDGDVDRRSGRIRCPESVEFDDVQRAATLVDDDESVGRHVLSVWSGHLHHPAVHARLGNRRGRRPRAWMRRVLPPRTPQPQSTAMREARIGTGECERHQPTFALGQRACCATTTPRTGSCHRPARIAVLIRVLLIPRSRSAARRATARREGNSDLYGTTRSCGRSTCPPGVVHRRASHGVDSSA